MKLEKEKVEHIAKLARIELSDEEKEKYSQELTTILNFVEKLKEVKTDNVEPTYQVSRVINSLRDDEVIKSNREEKLIKAAPGNNGKYVKVKAVLN
jgi:aspartyl-tRNA(Asn)/glutamyl-tRNA(Gln) amidotransferase subunit C